MLEDQKLTLRFRLVKVKHFRSDNDMYDHMNNSVYGFLYAAFLTLTHDLLTQARFDSVINAYLIEHCGLHPPDSKQIGLVVHSHCDFLGSVAFPSVVDLALRVARLGNASVTYEIGIFDSKAEDVRAVGSFTHVFVDRETNRPAAEGMPSTIRAGLQRIISKEASKL